jgi:hypothetical protein
VEVDDRDAAAQTLRDVINGPRPTVAVVNATKRTGIARDASEHIDATAYNLVGLGTSQQPAPTSVIITDEAHRAVASLLATQLGIATIDTKGTPPPTADFGANAPATPAQITIVLGNDFGKTPQQAAVPSVPQ